MAIKNSYSKARATKKSSSVNIGSNLNKKQQKKVVSSIKKSPILGVAVLFLIIGLVSGFFAFKMLSPFAMNEFLVNGVKSENNDYVIVDMSAIKDEYIKNNPQAEMADVYASVNLEDKIVTCKFLGKDVTDSISTKYFYREDISHDVQEVTSIDVSIAGVYYIEYTSSHFAFKNTTLVRTIIVTGVENG